MSIVKMYDSTVPQNIPSGSYVAAYFNGRFAWSQDEINSFPGHIMIGVRSGQPEQAIHARALDIETFDATVEDAAPFVRMRLMQGHSNATLYVNRSNRGLVVARCLQAGLKLGTDYRLWVATLDGTTVLPDMTGVWAVQSEGGLHAPFDVSQVHEPHDFTRPVM